MVTITRVLEFDMGHRIPDHQSKCRFLHGHRYRAEFTLGGPLLQKGSSAGMVMDFGDVKRAMKSVLEGTEDFSSGPGFDHHLALYKDDPLVHQMKMNPIAFTSFGVVLVPFIPTVENLAEDIGRRIWHDLKLLVSKEIGDGLVPISLKLFETPNCWAVYYFQKEVGE